MDRIAELYEKHFEFVWGLLRRAHVSKADLDDLLHEVFIVVQRKLPTFNPTTNFENEERAWIYTITLYEVMNHRRRQRPHRLESMVRTDEIPDPRDEAACVEVDDQLLMLLDSTTPDRRAVFELVEIEGFSVVDAARTLKITESNAHRRLGLARQDVRKAAEQLAQRDRDAGKKEESAFLLPFGVGAWLHFRDLFRAPEGTADRIWQRLQETIAATDHENDRPATPPQQPRAPARTGRLLKAIGRSLKAAIRQLPAAVVGGAIVALLLLPRPAARIAILRIPGPVVIVTSPSTATVEAPALDVRSEPAPTRATPTASAKTDPSEARLIRQAQAAYTAGKIQETIDALNAYEAQFPTGQLRDDARALRAALRDTRPR